MSEESKTLSKEFEKSENDLKALQSVGQVRHILFVFNLKLNLFRHNFNLVLISIYFVNICLPKLKIVGEVLKQLTEEKC